MSDSSWTIVNPHEVSEQVCVIVVSSEQGGSSNTSRTYLSSTCKLIGRLVMRVSPRPLLFEEAIELLLGLIMRKPADTASLPFDSDKMLLAVDAEDHG